MHLFPSLTTCCTCRQLKLELKKPSRSKHSSLTTPHMSRLIHSMKYPRYSCLKLSDWLLPALNTSTGTIKDLHPLLNPAKVSSRVRRRWWGSLDGILLWATPPPLLLSIALPSLHHHDTKITTGLCLSKALCFSSQTFPCTPNTHIQLSAHTQTLVQACFGFYRVTSCTCSLFLSAQMHYLTWILRSIWYSHLFRQ